jgi:hypothetical protein
MEFDQSILWKGVYVTLMMLFIGVFHTSFTDKLVYQKQNKRSNYERIYT